MPPVASSTAKTPARDSAWVASMPFVFVIIWIAAESVNTFTWVAVTTVMTAFYFLSRGIAKASRVLEQ